MESLFFYYDTFSPTFMELLTFLFLASQMVYLLFFTSHIFFGPLLLGMSANYFLAIFLSGLLINFLFFADPFYASFSGHINVNSQTLLVKGFMLFTSFIVVIFSSGYLRLKNIRQYEFSLLLLFSIAGLALTTLAADFLLIFMSLELQGLAFYLLAAFYWGSEFNAEASLKYFVLASFTSAMLLFGFSLIYAVSGSASFETIQILSHKQGNSCVVFLGLTLSLSAFLFKVGAAPFHIWLCDVYEGALTTVTFFFATVPKLIIFNVILTLLFSVFLFENFYWSIFCQISGALSIALASIAALFQKKTKRLIAYSAVSNSGFVLLSLSCFSILSLKASFFYLMVYVFTNFSVFAVIIITTKAHILKYLINWSDFFNRNAAAGATFAIMLFSLSGIPPLAGFYSKFLIIVAVVYQSKNLIALFIALFSCIACYYYIRLVKIIFFCKSNFGVWVKVQYRTVELGTASFSTALVILLIHSDFLILFSNMFATSFF